MLSVPDATASSYAWVAVFTAILANESDLSCSPKVLWYPWDPSFSDEDVLYGTEPARAHWTWERHRTDFTQIQVSAVMK